VGFAKAVELRLIEMTQERQKLAQFKNQIISRLLEIKDTFLNGHRKTSLANIINCRFSYIEGEALLLLLNDQGIAASTGSACSSRSLEPSHVLKALGLPPDKIHGSLRLSLGKFTTKEDISYLLEVLPEAVQRLRKMSPLAI
jgi:cysteine desulfurase